MIVGEGEIRAKRLSVTLGRIDLADIDFPTAATF